MRCTCNTGGTPRYIVMLNGQQLRCDDPTTQEPPKPLNICAFYHSITVPSDEAHQQLSFIILLVSANALNDMAFAANNLVFTINLG